MLDSNTILGIRGYLECEEYKHGLLTQNNDAWPCGTPIVYAANSLEENQHLRRSTRVYTLMPPSQSSGGVETSQVYTGAISPVGLKPLYNNHKVLTVSRFDIGKFDRLLEFVRDVGGISLVVEYREGQKEISNSVRQLEKIFKYSSLFHFNVWPDKYLWDKNDKLVCVLTLLDIPYCVPLFNMHKVDGIGLSLSSATLKMSTDYGHLHKLFRADFIYSNYEDNIFFMDGIAINSVKSPDSAIYHELNKLMTQCIEIGKSDKKKTRKFSLKTTQADVSSEEAVEIPEEGAPLIASLETTEPSVNLYYNDQPVEITNNGTVNHGAMYHTTTVQYNTDPDGSLTINSDTASTDDDEPE